RPQMTIVISKREIETTKALNGLVEALEQAGSGASFLAGEPWMKVTQKPGVKAVIDEATRNVIAADGQSGIARSPSAWLSQKFARLAFGPIVAPALTAAVVE